MKKTCYVIMPYGGDDLGRQSHFEGIYENIIKAAARKAGFADAEILRQDHTGEVGMIINNVILNMTSSSIVIADITGGNANVHYELGISHVFHKCATVMICEKGTKMPFDLQSLNVIEYTYDIGTLARSIDRICDAIQNRLEGRSSADNSVHEIIRQLPVHLQDFLEQGENEIQKLNQQLSAENEKLKRRLEAAGVKDEGLLPKSSVRSIMLASKERLKYAGSKAVPQLKKHLEEGDLDSFVDYFISFMELGTPTISNIKTIVDACDNIDNPPLFQAVLESARVLFPEDSELMTRLAKQYAKTPATREKALKLVHSALGLERDEEGRFCAVDKSKINHNNLARTLDSYMNLAAYRELIEVAQFLLTHGAEASADMLHRNIFSAYTKMGDLESAASYIPIIEEIGTDIAYYQLSLYYNKAQDYIKEYICLEKAMVIDPDDMDYPRMLAAHILNEKLVRTGPDTIEILPAKAARSAAVGFLYHILEKSRSNQQTVMSVAAIMQRKFNGISEYLDAARPFIAGKTDALSYEGVDRKPLEYCLEQIRLANS